MGSFYAANQLLVNNIARSFHASDNKMAILVSALYAGPMLMVLVFGELSDRVGRKKIAILALLIVCFGSSAIMLSSHFYITAMGFLMYGIGIGGTECVMIAMTADINQDKAGQKLQLNQALFSVGAMVSPILVHVALGMEKYRLAYGFILLICIITILYFIKFPQSQLSNETRLFEDLRNEKLHVFHLLRSPWMLLYMAIIVIMTASESALTYWASVYFEFLEVPQLGAMALSIYWCASIGGRLLCSRISKVEKVLIPCLSSATIGLIWIILIPEAQWKLLGFFIVGAAFAPLYPSLGFLASKVFPGRTGAAFSLITFSSNLGGVLFQPMMGVASNKIFIVNVYIGITFLCGFLSLVVFATRRLNHISR